MRELKKKFYSSAGYGGIMGVNSRLLRVELMLLVCWSVFFNGGDKVVVAGERDIQDSQSVIKLKRNAKAVQSPEDLFLILDEDRNGCVDRTEWKRRRMAIFFVLDREGSTKKPIGTGEDNQLSPNEVPAMQDEMFAQIDENQDGMISAFEFNQANVLQYDAVMTSNKECINLDEFKGFVQSLRVQITDEK